MFDRIPADDVITKHGLPAEDVPEKNLPKYLCSMAADMYGNVYSNACEECGICAYGRRWVELQKRKEKTA